MIKVVKINLVCLFLLFLGLTACEDVIDVPLQSADELIVVDAWLNTTSEDQVIYLQQSQSYFDNNIPRPITGASVQVESSTGQSFIFNESEPGKYIWEAGLDSLGAAGNQFVLQIDWNGNNLNASTSANRVPLIDSIGQKIEEESISGPAGTYTNFYARDIPGFGDTYWIKTFKNGNYLNKPGELNIAYDAGFDVGAQVDGLVYIPPIRDLTNPEQDDDLEEIPPPWKTGDEIRVEIHSISNAAFSFLETTRDQINNGDNGLFAIPIANTKGNVINVSNGETVLGMFNVAVVSSITSTIK